MNNLCFFYLAKMVVVFILMLSLATLEAQRNENDKFFDLMTAIGEHLGGEFNDTEKALELDLNGANSFLEGLHKFATREIVTKKEIGEFECKESTQKPAFIKAIKTILGEDMLNLLKLLSVKSSDNEAYALSTVLDEKLKPNKKVENLKSLLKELSVKFSEEKLFNILFSLAARLEALVHGKNIDGTLKEKEENPKDKIQTFLAVPKCFQESELKIFDYWIEIIEMKTKNSQKPIFGVAIYKEKYGLNKSEDSKEKAFRLSRENYKILKQLNDQKFSIYETSNLLREIFNRAYYRRKPLIPDEKMPGIFVNLLLQIQSVFEFNWEINEYWDKNKKCAYALVFQNISENLMKIKIKKGICPKLHLDSHDLQMQKYVQKEVEERCKKFENEEAQIIFLNNVHHELAINFEYNQRKDIYGRAKKLLSDWRGHLSEELYLEKNASQILHKIKNLTSEKKHRESISIIEALIGNEHFNQFNLGALFDEIKWLVEVAIPEEEANIAEKMKKKNTKQLENDIKFMKPNLKEQARTLAKTFEKMLQNVKEHYAQKMDE